jgi:hypothetical protein
LYFAGSISDSRAHDLLHCYADTVDTVLRAGVVRVEGADWRLAPGVVAFLKLAEASLAHFPPQEWIFGSPLRDPLAATATKPACFLAMPYGPPWFGAVRDAVESAATTAGYEFDIASNIAMPGGIMNQVWNSVRSAEVVVADLTGLNANVMYELGVAHALGKATILITQHTDQLPFDVSGMRWHAYDLSDLRTLNGSLLKSFAETQRK